MSAVSNENDPAETQTRPAPDKNIFHGYSSTSKSLSQILMTPPTEHNASTLQRNEQVHQWSLASRDAQRFQSVLQDNQKEKLANRPKETRRAYDSRQKLYVEWCKKQEFTDGDLVTPGKTLDFLRNYVIKRGNTREKLPNGESQNHDIELIFY